MAFTRSQFAKYWPSFAPGHVVPEPAKPGRPKTARTFEISTTSSTLDREWAAVAWDDALNVIASDPYTCEPVQTASASDPILDDEEVLRNLYCLSQNGWHAQRAADLAADREAVFGIAVIAYLRDHFGMTDIWFHSDNDTSRRTRPTVPVIGTDNGRPHMYHAGVYPTHMHRMNTAQYSLLAMIMGLPHMSKNHPGKVAFYESEARARKDVWTVSRPARWLARYLPNSKNYRADEAALAHLSRLISERAEKVTFHLATTPDDIVRVYERGPRSCMSNEGCDYYDGHPCRVYGAGDLGVAYIKRGNRITGRAVVNLKKKQYAAIYGDDYAGEKALSEEGYTRNSMALAGCRLKLVPVDRSTIVAPYIDGSAGFARPSACGEFAIINDKGDGYYLQDHTDGVAVRNVDWHCTDCGEGFTHDDPYERTVGAGRVCEHCIDEHDWRECEVRNRYTREFIETEDGYIVSRRAIRDGHTHSCVDTGARYLYRTNMHRSEHDGELRCDEAHQTHLDELSAEAETEATQ